MQISTSQIHQELTAAIRHAMYLAREQPLASAGMDAAAAYATEVLTRCGLTAPATIPNPPELEDLPRVAGDTLGGTLSSFVLRCLVLLNEEQNEILPNNARVAVLCDAVRLARDYERVARMNEDRVDLERFERVLAIGRPAGESSRKCGHPWFACLTGDCPHETSDECAAAIAEEMGRLEHAAECAQLPRNRGHDWGKPIRYLSDDRDQPKPNELQIMRGGNGDFYVSVCPRGERTMQGVRIATSGGAAFEVPALVSAICNAYDALYFADHDASHRGGVRDPMKPAAPAMGGDIEPDAIGDVGIGLTGRKPAGPIDPGGVRAP